MQEIINSFLIPFLTALGAGFITWLFARNRNTADTKSVQIDNEIKSAGFFQNLLDDATRRLNDSILAIEQRDLKIKDRDDKIDQLIDAIEHRDIKIKERDAKIDQLIKQVEIMTDELRKYKQLNGKEH